MKDLSTQNAKTQALNNTLPSQEVARLHSCIVEMRNQIEKLDRILNKTIDAHEVTKQRLLGYENEAGVPMSASEREAYVSYQETVAHNERMNRMQD